MLERFTDWLEHGPLRGMAKCLVADTTFFTLGRSLARRYPSAPPPAWEDMLTGESARDAGNVVLTTSCPRYFEAFHEGLLRSARRHSPDTLLHFHIIGISRPRAQAYWQALRESAASQSVALSWQARPEGVPEKMLPAYYQNARYLLARQALDIWRRPLFVMDIDVQLLAPLERAVALADGRDVCLTRRPRQCPSRRYLAGFSLFADTSGSRAFLATYERLFQRYSGLLFFPKFDQRLLYMAATRMKRGAMGGFAFNEVITSDDARETERGCFVFYPKGPAKWVGGGT